MPAKQTQGKKGGKKIGRNKKKCERYRLFGRREFNKKRKAEKKKRKFERRKKIRESKKIA